MEKVIVDSANILTVGTYRQGSAWCDINCNFGQPSARLSPTPHLILRAEKAVSLAATGNPLKSVWTRERYGLRQAQLNCINVNPLREEQCSWNSAAAVNCVLWDSCAPCRQLCATSSCAPRDRRAPWERCAPDRAVYRAASCVPCEHRDSLLTAVHPEDSCVPCGQLHAIQTAVLPADSCAHCRQLLHHRRLGHRRAFCSPPSSSVPAQRHASRVA